MGGVINSSRRRVTSLYREETAVWIHLKGESGEAVGTMSG